MIQMGSDETLREIADELHNMNLNMCELINVLKEKKASSENNNTDADMVNTINILNEASRSYREHLSSINPNNEQIKSESEYQKKQADFDQVLKNLGVL